MKLPLARTEGLVTEELGDELLVYDTDVKNVHCLASKAARVWQSCDGKTTEETLSSQLELSPEEVAQALDELDNCDLLTSLSPAGGGYSRREFGFKVTKVAAGAAALPLILSIAAPAAAATASQIAFCAAIQGDSAECGTCNEPTGTNTVCCCCQTGKGNKICAAGDEDCETRLSGNCTEKPGDDKK